MHKRVDPHTPYPYTPLYPPIPRHAPYGRSHALGLPDNVAFTHAAESRLGAFEVFLVTNFADDGVLALPRVAGLHSKLWTRRFPSAARLVREVQHVLLPVFRRCVRWKSRLETIA